jgi:hypothetical protein
MDQQTCRTSAACCQPGHLECLFSHEARDAAVVEKLAEQRRRLLKLGALADVAPNLPQRRAQLAQLICCWRIGLWCSWRRRCLRVNFCPLPLGVWLQRCVVAGGICSVCIPGSTPLQVLVLLVPAVVMVPRCRAVML